MLKKWLKKVFIESWREYEETFPCETTAMRNPTEQDIQARSRKGHVWINKATNKKFVLKFTWCEMEDGDD